MAKRNEITVGQNSQLSVQTAVQTAVRNNMAVRIRNGVRGRFSRDEAVKAVLEAIKVTQDPGMTEEQIREGTLLAVEIVSNSDAIQENGIQQAIDIMQDNPPF